MIEARNGDPTKINCCSDFAFSCAVGGNLRIEGSGEREVKSIQSCIFQHASGRALHILISFPTLLHLCHPNNMSSKIKSKDLSYDDSLPPFLQRLYAQKAGSGDSDRHERAIRPRKEKEANDDDGPTVVDESGETVSKDELEKMTAAAAAEEDATGDLATDTPLDSDQSEKLQPAEQKVVAGAALRKRKAVKIIGDGDGDDRIDQAASGRKDEPRKVAKKGKKGKPIKLAFDDDEG